ncbi:hypothetical protein VI817_006251 [Penicillium citrinum]|nr:hypothetical protein VI817_006251 [Penicillium citrinum]
MKADVNAQNGQYSNTSQAALLRDNHEIVNLLLDKTMDIYAQGGPFTNALYTVYRNGNREIIKLLRERNAIILSSKRPDSRTLNNLARNLRLMDYGPFEQIRDSHVVTHHTTNLPACGLSTAERTGSPVLHTLWSYVSVK